MRPTASSTNPDAGERWPAGAAAGGDVLGAARAKNLSGVERRAAGPGHAMRSCRLADRIAAGEVGRAPCVDRKAAVHVLVVDREFERIARDVVFVALVELDRQRVHLAAAGRAAFPAGPQPSSR